MFCIAVPVFSDDVSLLDEDVVALFSEDVTSLFVEDDVSLLDDDVTSLSVEEVSSLPVSDDVSLLDEEVSSLPVSGVLSSFLLARGLSCLFPLIIDSNMTFISQLPSIPETVPLLAYCQPS